MPRIRFPRHGSLMYWPRKRAKSMVARVRTWSSSKEPKLLGFGGYKVGMTHAIVTDNRPNSITKGEGIQCPITIIECPPLKVAGLVLYTKDAYGLHCVGCILSSNLDKDLSRRLPFPKAAPKPVDQLKPEDYAEVRVLVHTQPKLTSSLNKKKPEMFELALGGSVKEKLDAARALLGKEVNAKDVLAEGTQFDAHSVTTGRGTQGPVKRFGVRIRHHKSEKTKRGPGNLGPWHGRKMWRVAHAGKMGFHTRTEINKLVIKIDADPAKVNAKGGFVRYGVVRNPYLLVKGSIPGPEKRFIKFTKAVRPDLRIPAQPPAIQYLSISSKQ